MKAIGRDLNPGPLWTRLFPCILASATLSCAEREEKSLSSSSAPASSLLKGADTQSRPRGSITLEYATGQGQFVRESTVKLLTKVEIPKLSDESRRALLAKAGVRVRLTHSQGTVLFDGTRLLGSQTELEWELPLGDVEGALTAEAFLESPNEQLFLEPEAPATRALLLDRTPPRVVGSALVTTALASGQRTLDIQISPSDISPTTCSQASLRDLAHPELNASWELTAVTTPEGVSQFSRAGQQLDGSWSDAIFVETLCKDAAGNATSFTVPMSARRADFQLSARVPGSPGRPIEGGDAFPFYRSTLPIALSLLDAATGQPVATSVLGKLEREISIYLSEDAPESVSALADESKFLKLPEFVNETSFVPNSAAPSLKTVHVTLVRKDAEGASLIQNSVELKAYLDSEAPKLAITTGNQFLPPRKTTAISVNVVSEDTEGAPLQGTPALQYSTDGLAWNDLTTEVVSSAPGSFRFTFNYPFDEETDFRVRARGTDIAGVSGSSKTSGYLVGVANLAEKLAAKEGSCGNNQAFLHPVLASSFLCPYSTSDLSNGPSTYRLSFFIINKGKSDPLFPSGLTSFKYRSEFYGNDGLFKTPYTAIPTSSLAGTTASYPVPVEFSIAPTHLAALVNGSDAEHRRLAVKLDYTAGWNYATQKEISPGNLASCYPAPGYVADATGFHPSFVLTFGPASGAPGEAAAGRSVFPCR